MQVQHNSDQDHSITLAAPDRFCVDRPMPIRHTYATHPLMQLPRLARLAKSLMPSGQCRFLKPGTTQTSAFDHQPQPSDGQDLDQLLSQIDMPGSWIALYDVQSDPEYAAFLDEVLQNAVPLIGNAQQRAFRVAGFVFISAPPSVTPFHIDRENNLWLQIRGRKTMTVFNHQDQAVLASRHVEDFIIDGSLERVRLDSAVRSRGSDFDVGPGDGVYFPSTSPHMTRSDTDWVGPGNRVSISIGVVFYTKRTRQHARVHQFNRLLRKLGRNPAPPGTSVWRDAIKAPLGWLLAASRERWRGYRAPPGAY